MILLNPKKGKFLLFIFLIGFSLGDFSFAQTNNNGYQKPPSQIAKIVEETLFSAVLLS